MSQKEITSKVPKLRFLEFQDEWTSEKMRKLTTLITNGFVGKATDHYVENDGILYIQGYNLHETGIDYHGIKFVSKTFHEKHKKSILKEGDLLTIQTGDVGVTGYVTPELVGSNCHALIISRYKDGIANSKFYHQYFNSHTGRGLLKTIETGSTMKHLNCGDMEKLDLPFTSLEEQQKIASFFSVIDEKIEKLKTKKSLMEKYKKGVMQKIFAREIRFRNENGENFGEWKYVALGDYMKQFSKRNTELQEHLVLSVNNKKGFITQEEQFDGYEVASKDLSTYKIVYKNQFAYNPSRINVGSIARLRNFESGIVSPMYIIFELVGMEKSYFEYLLGIQYIKHQIKIGCSGSVRDTLNFDAFGEIEINIPSLPEQEKISSFLSEIDKKIDVINIEIESTEKWKKGLLQGMFI